jgi:hypothetical protein
MAFTLTMLALTSPTNGTGSAGIHRMRTQATEFFFFNSLLSLLSRVHFEESAYVIYLSALCQGFPLPIIAVMRKFNCFVLHPFIYLFP